MEAEIARFLHYVASGLFLRGRIVVVAAANAHIGTALNHNEVDSVSMSDAAFKAINYI
jgi:hypothetical protein